MPTQKGRLVDMFPEADIQKNTPPKSNIYPLLSPYKACPAPHLAPSCAPPVAPSRGGCLKSYRGFVKIFLIIVVFQTPNDDDDDNYHLLPQSASINPGKKDAGWKTIILSF